MQDTDELRLTAQQMADAKQVVRNTSDLQVGSPQPSASSLNAAIQEHDKPDNMSTSNKTSASYSTCSTVQHDCPADPKSVRPQPQHTSASHVVQIKKGEKRTWYTYSQEGYRVTVKYFYEEIDSSWTAALLVACFFVSGLVDSVAFGVWSVFVAMQTSKTTPSQSFLALGTIILTFKTGNTIFLALRISGQPVTHHPLNFIKSLTSLISYCLGALVFNCLHRAPTGLSEPRAPLQRWTLITSFIIQSGLLLTAAILAQTSILSARPYKGGTFSSGSYANPGDNYLDLIGIALLAFEAAGQVCLSRVLLVNELPTIVLSTLYHDLIGEALGLCQSWRESDTTWDFLVAQKKQIRRLACIISLFGGALVGGFLFQSRSRLAAALWLAAGVKIGISIAWCLWKKKVVTTTVTTVP